MAEVKVANKKYAVVSSEGEKVIVRKMGVAERNIYGYPQYGELIRQMGSGDVLCVASISCFAVGACDMLQKFQWLIEKGIEFRSAQERYLDFSIIKPLSYATKASIRTLAIHEHEFVQMLGNSRLSIPDKNVLIRRIENEFLTCICVMFSNDGIKKKGN